MRRLLLVALVTILVVTGIPLLVAPGGMTNCSNCPPAVLTSGQCLGVLAGAFAVFAALLLTGRLRIRRSWLRPWLYARLFDRPPQLV